MKHKHVFMIVACAAALAAVCVDAYGVTLKLDQVRQRYPWNGLVDIDYTIALAQGETLGADDNLEVTVIDRSVEPAVTNRALAFLQLPLPLTAGSHRITWEANCDGVTNYTDKAEIVIKIVHYAPAYMVIDVSGGPTADVYPVDFLDGAPPLGGFFDNEYKGDKIVLRRIRPGSYFAGAPVGEIGRAGSGETQHRVRISRPFYIGIYEITQKQYENVMDATPSKNTDDYRPVEQVTYEAIRGGSWPTASEPDEDSFIGRLLKKCKAKDGSGNYAVPVPGFDLPTEFQWEYACRAGTTKAFNRTDDYDDSTSGKQQAELELLGRYAGNVAKGGGGFSKAHTTVGSYQPNAWGLYDMHGNVWELCRDWYSVDIVSLKQYVDPVGPDSAAQRVMRGGAYDCGYDWCRSAIRSGRSPSSGYESIGFRLSLTQP